MRYEDLVADPGARRGPVAERLDVPIASVVEAFSKVHDRSVGRWRRDLCVTQVADIEREAGETLERLGYA